MELTAHHQITALLAYLLGSVPFGLVLTRLAGLGDLRKMGSGNIGATNVLRTGNKPLAAATLILDSGKGAIAVLIAKQFGSDLALLAALFSVIGHNFPVWLKFEGGKGVATTLGAILALAWPVGLLACATWAAVAAIFRYSSLAALGAFVAAPFYTFWLVDASTAMVVGILALLGIVRHYTNIRRLLQGEEPRIGGAKATPPQDGG